jgi:hypothetical protein
VLFSPRVKRFTPITDRIPTLIRRLILPSVVTVILSFLSAVPPVVDARGFGSFDDGVSLVLPTGYVALSPVSRVLDALSLLSTAQSVSVFVSLAVIVVGFVLVRRTNSGRPLWRRLSIALGSLLVVIAIIEAAVVLLPRPMAELRVADPEVVRIDFHSHTGASHDVRKSFSAEDNRDWHRGAGFDIAYISDHVKFDGVIAARARNPRLAGEGTSLLSAVEGRYHKIMSTIMLGLTERDTALLNKRGNLLPGATASGRPPLTIVALPNRNLDSVTAETLDSLPRFRAIELVDAAPRGLAQLDREEAKVRALASRLGLVLVAASNNHGWGRTAAAWNLMRIPGWRSMPPDSVGVLIEEMLRQGDPSTVTIIRRTRPSLHGVAVAATLPVLAYQIIGSLTTAERVIWILMVWALFALRLRTSRSFTTENTETTE